MTVQQRELNQASRKRAEHADAMATAVHAPPPIAADLPRGENIQRHDARPAARRECLLGIDLENSDSIAW